MHPDEPIIQAVLAGQRDYYAALVDSYATRTKALAFSYLRDAQLAEDVAQEAFVRAYSALRTLTTPSAFGAWLAQITRNLCRAALRRRPPATSSLSEAQAVGTAPAVDPANQAAERQLRELVHEGLSGLPPKLREPIVLHYVEGQSLREIAEFLGLSENTVKQRLHRGRARLRERLERALEQELGGMRPSGGFTAAVMSLAPLRPADAGWLVAATSRMGATMISVPWIGPLLLTVATQLTTAGLMLADVNRPFRGKFIRSFGPVMLVGLLLLLPARMLGTAIIDYPWLSLLLLVPLAFIPAMMGKLSLTIGWYDILLAAAVAVTISLLCVSLAGPQHNGLHMAYPIGFLAVMILFMIHPAAAGRKPPADPGEPGPAPPVSNEWLREHALRFGKVLNAEGTWFYDFQVEGNCVRYISRMPRAAALFVRLLWAGRQPQYAFEARVFADGHTEVSVDPAPSRAAHLAQPEECQRKLQERIARKWAFYRQGESAAARAVHLREAMLPEGFFRTNSGFRLLRYSMSLMVVLYGALVLWQFRLSPARMPALTADEVRAVYAPEFLERSRLGFPDDETAQNQPQREAAATLRRAGLGSSDSRMVLYYRQPPSLMSLPEVAEAYRGLQEQAVRRCGADGVLYQARELINGLEAGYLSLEHLSAWGLNRRDVAVALRSGNGLGIPAASRSAGNTRLTSLDLGIFACRVRLLRAADLLGVVNSDLPRQLMEGLENRHAYIRVFGQDWGELETTCQAVCVLHAFDRLDLLDRRRVTDWLAAYPREHRFLLNADQVYWLGVAVVSLGLETELPLSKLVECNRPSIGVVSEKSPWKIDPYDVQALAVNEILSTGRLLELRMPGNPGQGR